MIVLNFGANRIYDLLYEKGVVLESVYADLIIIDNRETLTNNPGKVPSESIGGLLSNIQCPVLVVSHLFTPIADPLRFDGEIKK
ncbi:MAG: hypothetical protein ACXWWD_06290 [Chitinophagaceae bacterium]